MQFTVNGHTNPTRERGARWRIGPVLFVAVFAAHLLCAREAAQAAPARVVYLVGKISDEDLIVLTSAAATAEPRPVVLLDTLAVAPYLKDFFAVYRPDRVVPAGTFAEPMAEREQRLGIKLASALSWQSGQPAAVWDIFFRKAERVVVCPAQPRSLLLQAACLAGAAAAPLFIVKDKDGETEELRRRLASWKTREVFAVGRTAQLVRQSENARITELPDEQAVFRACLSRQPARGKMDMFIVANPADALARLAPWLAIQRRAALLLTNGSGDNAAALVRAALKHPGLSEAETLLLLGDLKAIPMERRPNPVAGKDVDIEMEPFTPEGREPFTFATGRLFHPDAGVVMLTLARQRLLAESRGTRHALVASNPGGSLPLMEMFSRHTARELRNRGYQTVALFEHDVNKNDVRRRLPDQDIFLWEGHYKTMVEEYKLPSWKEPLRPSLVFLQSCLALNEIEAQPLIQRGAVAVVGSSTRTYSGTGGAFTLAFFDALLYEEQPLGGALRQAKNFLLAYSLLKEKRLGENARLSGVNVRSAWAFTLWGDPTLSLPRPERADDALPAVRHEVKGNVIVITPPEQKYERVTTAGYTAQSWPNARLAGLLKESGEEDTRQFVPFLFAEVRLFPPKSGQAPRLRSKLRDKNWVFVWDARRKAGYLLVVPLRQQPAPLRFQVDWTP